MGRSKLWRPSYDIILVAAAFAATAGLGEIQWSLGVFFKALESDFGWSRALVSSGYTFLAVGYGVSSIAFGRLADKYPPARILLTAAAVSGTSLFCCSRIETIPQLQALLFATGLGAGALIPVPTATVGRWFEHRRGGAIALGATMAGVGAGAVVFAPLFSWLILTLGWRPSFALAGAIFWCLLSFAALVMRAAPHATKADARTERDCTRQAATLDRGKLLRAPQFVQVVAIMVVTTLSFQVMTVHLVPFAIDAGVSQPAAAAALGLSGALSIPGRLSSGFLSERFGWARTLALSQAGMAAGMIGLLLVHRDPGLFAIVAVYGYCQGVRAVSVIGVLSRAFGMSNIGQLIGIMIAISHGTAAVGPYLAGFTFDRFGSYAFTFVPLGAAMLLGAILSLRMEVDSPAYPASTRRGRTG